MEKPYERLSHRVSKLVLGVLALLALLLALAPAPGMNPTAYADEPTTVSDEVGFLAAADTGGSVKLGGDIKLEAHADYDFYRIDLYKDMVLDLNGHALELGTNVYFDLHAKLIVRDSAGGGVLRGYCEDRMIAVSASGSLTLASGTLDASFGGINGWAVETGDGPFTMSGGMIKCAGRTYAIKLGKGNASILGGTITREKWTSDQGFSKQTEPRALPER